MRSCDRFETEALLALEQGKEIDPHFSICPDCLEQRRAYEGLKRTIADVNADAVPRPAWEARVRRAMDAERSMVLRRLVPLAAAAVLVVALIAVLKPPAQPPRSGLQAEIRSGGPGFRGEARPGDILVLGGNLGSFAHAELRVYRNETELVLSCVDELPCIRSRREVQAEFELESPGTYQPALFLSDRPIDPTGTGLDADAEAVLRAGGVVDLPPAVEVR